jgi:hypothetical protein
MSSLLEKQLRETLADQPAPGELAAGRRSWPVIEAALAERAPVTRRARRPALRLALVAALLAMGLAAALSPAGAEVGRWIEERVGLAPDDSEATLAGFPRGGRLLAVSSSGAWVVDAGGALSRLGDYREVGWSPRGLYVIGTRGRRLTAMEPSREPRWSLLRPRRVHHPAWSPGDGFRVAYLESSGRRTSLRVVDGSGQLDHEVVAAAAARVTPAWRPRGGRYALTYAREPARARGIGAGAAAAPSGSEVGAPIGRRAGTPEGAGPGIATVDADSGARLWSARTGSVPLELAWTRDGRRLAVLLPNALRIYARDGRLQIELRLERGARPAALALHPSGGRAALALTRRGESRVVDVRLGRDPAIRRRLFSGPGTFSELAWSPGGRRLLVAWPEANQWLLIGGRRPRAFAGISRELDPGRTGAGFPRIAGWCCPR